MTAAAASACAPVNLETNGRVIGEMPGCSANEPLGWVSGSGRPVVCSRDAREKLPQAQLGVLRPGCHRRSYAHDIEPVWHLRRPGHGRFSQATFAAPARDILSASCYCGDVVIPDEAIVPERVRRSVCPRRPQHPVTVLVRDRVDRTSRPRAELELEVAGVRAHDANPRLVVPVSTELFHDPARRCAQVTPR
jgi:hypothetical protein